MKGVGVYTNGVCVYTICDQKDSKLRFPARLKSVVNYNHLSVAIA